MAVTCIRRLRISSVKSRDDNEPRDVDNRFADKVAKMKTGGQSSFFNSKLGSVDFLIEGNKCIHESGLSNMCHQIQVRRK